MILKQQRLAQHHKALLTFKIPCTVLHPLVWASMSSSTRMKIQHSMPAYDDSFSNHAQSPPHFHLYLYHLLAEHTDHLNIHPSLSADAQHGHMNAYKCHCPQPNQKNSGITVLFTVKVLVVRPCLKKHHSTFFKTFLCFLGPRYVRTTSCPAPYQSPHLQTLNLKMCTSLISQLVNSVDITQTIQNLSLAGILDFSYWARQAPTQHIGGIISPF